MKFIYGRQDFKTFERGEENCYLMTNGLGGFSALTMLGSCGRNDHAVLMGCRKEEAPNHRYNMIHRLEELLYVGEKKVILSSQDFLKEGKREEGYRYLSVFTYEDYPQWVYQAEGVEIRKKIVMAPFQNAVGISYTLTNQSGVPVTLRVRPQMEFVPKGKLLDITQAFTVQVTGSTCRIASNGLELWGKTNGSILAEPTAYCEDLYYAYDACDGRCEEGHTAANHSVIFEIQNGGTKTCELVYSMEAQPDTAAEMEHALLTYRRKLLDRAGLQDETAKALVTAANQFISYRASTGKQTILAGYPFFEDWGRDTMIAVTGLCLSAKQYTLAVSILRTFMENCNKGLMPNLFPEGANQPRYNTVDAALLFIIVVYEYYRRTEDLSFVREAWPVMEEILSYYEKGTDFGIGMDTDGLIRAGQGYDQVTWMDVRIGDILPTPRHGKPVEINAYWYNALCIMDLFRKVLEPDAAKAGQKDYSAMAALAKKSFNALFWNEEAHCLKDVISGTKADKQIRCNQIWAVSLPFSVLDREKEKQVVETVYRRLYTPLGLRTLDPDDQEFHPVYTGKVLERDLAYHQGTVWTFPMGGYYLAYLKVHDYAEEAKQRVRMQLEGTTAALREGCIGQLPEIYDGLEPASSKGCFAQAWSVGEILRVFEALEA